jgi:hypothetical protein
MGGKILSRLVPKNETREIGRTAGTITTKRPNFSAPKKSAIASGM